MRVISGGFGEARDLAADPNEERIAGGAVACFAVFDLESAVIRLVHVKIIRNRRPEIIGKIEADGCDFPDAEKTACPQRDITRRRTGEGQSVLTAADCRILLRPLFVVHVE